VCDLTPGDPDVQELLPATVAADRVALVGLHAWANDDIANVAHWGIGAFSPDELRATTQPLLDWLAASGCSRVAIHFDVDTIDSNELVLGLGAEQGGLTTLDTGRRTCAYSVSRSMASAMARIPVSFGCTPSPLSYSGRIRSGSVGSANTRSRSTTAS
jgi:hypothetical protein